MKIATKKKMVQVLKDYKAGKNGHGDTPLNEDEVIIALVDFLHGDIPKTEERFVVSKHLNKKILTPADLVFEESEIIVGGKQLKLKKYSIPVKWYFIEKYPNFEQLILAPKSDKIFAEIAYKLLKNETIFDNFEQFSNTIADNKEILSIIDGAQQAMGQKDIAYMTEKEWELFQKEKK